MQYLLLGTVLVLFLGAFATGYIIGDDSNSSPRSENAASAGGPFGGTGSEEEGSEEDAPSVDDDEPEEAEEDEPVSLGESGLDEGLEITLNSFEQEDSLSGDLETITPEEGAKLYVASIAAENLGKLAVSPFCGGGGTVLVDDEGRNFDAQAFISSDSDACEDVQPGFSADDIVVYFQIPLDAQPDSLYLWNDDKFNNIGLVYDVAPQSASGSGSSSSQ